MNNSIEPAVSEPLLTSFGIRWQMFKAAPEETDQFLDPFYSLTFSPGDIRDLRSFAKKLTQKKADPASDWLWRQLDDSVQSALQKYNGSQKSVGSKRVRLDRTALQNFKESQEGSATLQWTLVQVLNKVIKSGRINEALFDVTKQRDLTKSMISQELHGCDLVRRNRMLLADQYPELAREPKKTITIPTISGVAPLNSIAETERRNLENDHAIRRDFLWDFECDAENLNWLAGKDEKALGVLTRVSSLSVNNLAALARNGNEQALRTLVEVAEFATEAVNGFGTENTVIKGMAKERLAWPVLASTRSEFAPVVNLKTLGLGSAHFPKDSGNARFGISDPVGKVAFRLYRYVQETRMKAIAVAQKKGVMAKLKAGQHQRRALSIEERTSLLPEFKNESTVIKAWWDVAKMCLIEAYPHPTLAGELDEQVPALNELVKADSHRKTDNVLRCKILEKLEGKFYSFGGWHIKQG